MANTTGKKYGGRKKGTPNKLSKELRIVLKDVLFNELVNIETHLESLEPKERIELIIRMLPFVLPKMQQASHTINEPIDYEHW